MDWEMLLEHGIIAYREGRITEAINDLESAWRLNPLSYAICFTLGNAYAKMGRHKEATEVFRLCCTLEPQASEPHANMANSYLALGDFDSAVNEFEEALRLNPNDRVAKTNLSAARSLKEAKKGVVISGSEADFWYDKGNSHYTKGCFNEAVDCYCKALKIDPKFAFAWNNLGSCLSVLGQFEKASECCDEALRLQPEDSKAWFNKGVSLFGLHSFKEALVYFAGACELDPQYAKAWFNKASTEETLGMKQEAAKSYREFLRVATAQNADQIAIARQRLRELEER